MLPNSRRCTRGLPSLLLLYPVTICVSTLQHMPACIPVKDRRRDEIGGILEICSGKLCLGKHYLWVTMELHVSFAGCACVYVTDGWMD